MRKLPEPTYTVKPTDLYEVEPPFELDEVELLEAMKAAEAAHEYTLKFVRTWQSIPLRSYDGLTGVQGSMAAGIHATTFPEKFKDTPVMQPYFRRILDALVEQLSAVGVLKVRIMRLSAGGKICHHHDLFKAGNKVRRYHIPLVTNPKVEFSVNMETYQMLPRKIYCIDVSQIHAVFNRGAEARVHLVFDLAFAEE